jgi:hypothetical protein
MGRKEEGCSRRAGAMTTTAAAWGHGHGWYTDVSRLRTEAGRVIGRGYEEEPLQRLDAGRAHDLLWIQPAFHVAGSIAMSIRYYAHLRGLILA